MGGRKLPSPLPSSTLTVSSPALTVARSRLPSLLKSATASERGSTPVAKVRAVWKVPSPLPSSTLTVPSWLAVARSSLPSLLKSPVTTAWGWLYPPTG